MEFNLSIAQVLSSYPHLVPVFLKYRTKCVGCAMAAFCNVEDAIRLHQLENSGFHEEVTDGILPEGVQPGPD